MKGNLTDAFFVLTGANTFFGLLSVIWGKAKGVKTAIFIYGKDVLVSKKNPLQLLFLQLNLSLTDKIGVNSKATARLLPKKFSQKVHVLYPGIDVQTLRRYQRKYSADEKSGKKLLFVGRLIERKGVDDLLKAFKLVLKEMPQAKLTIVGDGPERRVFHDLAKQLRIHDRVEFSGTLTGRKLYRKYQECNVFVMPSKRIAHDVEGFGMVFLEASFFKKPSIGTWSGGIPEAVLHNQTGLLVPEGDVEALSNALIALLSNKKLEIKLGRNAYNRVISEFSWENVTSELIKMCR